MQLIFEYWPYNLQPCQNYLLAVGVLCVVFRVFYNADPDVCELGIIVPFLAWQLFFSAL